MILLPSSGGTVKAPPLIRVPGGTVVIDVTWQIAQPIWLKGSPFRGLASYDFDDAPIFFGRDGAIRTATTRLLAAAERVMLEVADVDRPILMAVARGEWPSA